MKSKKTVRVPKSTAQKAAQIAKVIRILLYLGIAILLFTKVRAEETTQFEKKSIQLGQQKLLVEIADDDYKRSRGLMYRTELKEGQGMLFIFDGEQILSFWMKNTLIPLSIGYFDKDKTLIEVLDMKPASPMELSPPSYRSSRPGVYALEVPKGWFTQHKIKPGAKFTFAGP